MIRNLSAASLILALLAPFVAGAARADGADAAADGADAADEPVSKSRLSGVAVGGHDVTAYRELPADPHGAAVEGERGHTVEYKGAKWRFASAEDAATFAADPERHVPAYNGYCANALSLGEGLVRTDGTHWEIFDGDDRLYLFYAGAGRDRWVAGDWRSYRIDADRAWEPLSR